MTGAGWNIDDRRRVREFESFDHHECRVFADRKTANTGDFRAADRLR